MRAVGTIKEIWRYPVKGMAGESLASCALGEALIDCAAATPRCGAITRAQPELPADKTILRTVVQRADQNVGIYGQIAMAGAVRLGDAVYLD